MKTFYWQLLCLLALICCEVRYCSSAGSCGEPPYDVNKVTKTGDSYLEGDIVTFVCKDGYTHAGGPQSRECKKNGQAYKWTGSEFTCKSDGSVVISDTAASTDSPAPTTATTAATTTTTTSDTTTIATATTTTTADTTTTTADTTTTTTTANTATTTAAAVTTGPPTLCDDSWVEYKNNCYKFIPTNSTFVEAIDYCVARQARLISVTNEDEQKFLQNTINGSAHLLEPSNYYVGLYDHHQMAQYTWTDGHLVTFTNFGPNHDHENKKCVVMTKNDTGSSTLYPWSSVNCDEANAGTICKKNNLGSIGCFPRTNESGIFQLASVHMTISLCIEQCRAHHAVFASLQNSNCWCDGETPLTFDNSTGVNMTHCSLPCPGNEAQRCGGPSFLSVFRVGQFQTAKSCHDLQHNNVLLSSEYIIQSENGTEHRKTCDMGPVDACPSSWIFDNGACYKFYTGNKDFWSASDYCRSFGGHLLTVLDHQHQLTVNGLLDAVRYFDNENLWTLGGYLLSGQYYSWSDGALWQYEDWLSSEPNTNKSCVVYDRVNKGWASVDCGDRLPFICQMQSKTERKNGCYDIPSREVSVYGNSSGNTASLCIETCRVSSKLYAAVTESGCYCTDVLTSQRPLTQCASPCPANKAQLCGSNNTAAYFYKIDSYHPAHDCSTLHRGGLPLDGVYSIELALSTGSLLPVNACCEFSDPAVTGIHVNGHCYYLHNQSMTVLEARRFCLSINSLIGVVNNHIEKQDFIDLADKFSQQPVSSEWFAGLFDVYGAGRVIASDGQLVDFDNTTSSYHRDCIIVNSDGLFSNNSWTYNANPICEVHPGYKGCYSVSGEEPTVSSNVHMTVTGCIEFCRGRGDHYGAVSGQHCYCTSNMTSWTRRPSDSDCDGGCPANKFQVCGNATLNYTSVYYIDYYPILASSCDYLWEQLVRVAGQYYIIIPGDERPTLVECFNTGTRCDDYLVQSLPDSAFTGSAAVSNGPDATPRQARLFSGMGFTADVNTSAPHFVKASLGSPYIITAIVTQGGDMINDASASPRYANQISIGYTNSFGQHVYLNGSVVGGNSDSSSLVFNYLSQPFVADSVSIIIESFVYQATIRFDALGCAYQTHLTSFWACLAESSVISEVYLSVNLTTVQSATQCIDLCKSGCYGYAGLVNGTSCACTNSYGKYGKVNDDECNLPCSGNASQTCGGTNRVALYRTWDTLCPPVQPGNNTVHNTTDRFFGTVVGYHCLPGYKPAAGVAMSTVCTDQFLWQDEPPNCIMKRCPAPPNVTYATYSATGDFVNSTVLYTCSRGYKFINGTNKKTVTCNETEQWEPSVMSCVLKECGAPAIAPNATVLYTNVTYLSTATYSCLPGHIVSNANANVTSKTSFTVTCTEHENWTEASSCEPVSCGNPPQHALSTMEVEGVYYNQSVHYTCVDGYELDVNGSTSQTLVCDENGQWPTLTLSSCIVIHCGIPPSVPHSDLHYTSDTYRSIARYQCHFGYMFSENIFTNTSECQSNKNWTVVEPCVRRSCGVPSYAADNTHITLKYSFLFQDSVEFTCASGHQKSDGSSSRTCTVVGNYTMKWNGDEFKCENYNHYEGCFRIPNITTSSLIALTDDSLMMDTCRDNCRVQSKHLSALYNGSWCLCLDSTDSVGGEKIDDVMCNASCSGQGSWCGGLVDEFSVWWTFHGHYSNISINDSAILQSSDTLHIHYVDMKGKICLDYCRGLKYRYAIAHITDCYCTQAIDNTTSVVGVMNDTYKADVCQQSLCPGERDGNVAKGNCGSSSCYFVYVDEPYPIRGRGRCSDYYNTGNYMHSTYLSDRTDGVSTYRYCNMKDNSVCEDGWVGYKDSCYNFTVTTEMNFTEATDYCALHQSMLVSIATPQEHSFLQDAIKRRNSLYGPSSYYLGFFDHHQVSRFTWVDGSLVTYTNFFPGAPSDSTKRCAVLTNVDNQYTFGRYQWKEVDCSSRDISVICKKNKGYLGCFNRLSSGTFYLNSTDMTIAYCIETCRRENGSYAALMGSMCYCDDERLTLFNISNKLNMLKCSLACPRNIGQRCGGPDDVISVFNIGSFYPAKSCSDLRHNDLPSGRYYIDPDSIGEGNETNVQECDFQEGNGCQPSWFWSTDRCYKFHTGSKTFSDAQTYCESHQSHVVTISSATENSAMTSIMHSSPYLEVLHAWFIGAYDPFGFSLNFTWSDASLWSYSRLYYYVNTGARCTYMDKWGNWGIVSCATMLPFICETETGMSGCGLAPMVAPIYENYTDNTGTLCIETCRARNSSYAAATSHGCYCVDTANATMNSTYCLSCPGNERQRCGSTAGWAYFYQIAKYPLLADSCESLYLKGVRRSGVYTIDPDGASGPSQSHNVTCTMADETTGCPSNYIGWRGNCYLFSMSPKTWIDANDVCIADGGSLAPMLTSHEANFITTTIKGLKSFSEGATWLIGSSEPENHEVHTWVSGQLLVTQYTGFHNVYGKGCKELQRASSFNSLVDEHCQGVNKTGNYVCKIDMLEFVGCVSLPTHYQVRYDPYHRLTNTHCRELCRGRNHLYAGSVKDVCYCLNQTEVDSLTKQTNMSACSYPCPANPYQRCGGPAAMTTYFVGSTCAPGWVHNKGQCYLKSSGTLGKFYQQKEYCLQQALLSNVASVDSMDENSYLASFGSTNMWLGLTFSNSRWLWLDGSQLLNSSWAPSPLANHACAVLTPSGDWLSQSCDEKNEVVCKREAAPLSPVAGSCSDLYKNGVFLIADYLMDTSNISQTSHVLKQCGIVDDTLCKDHNWFGFKGHCYLLVKTGATALAAHQHCLSHNSLVAVVSDAEEERLLRDFATHIPWANYVWHIGLFDVYFNNHLTSADGQVGVTSSYQRVFWQNAPFDCTRFNRNGLIPEQCTLGRYFMCEQHKGYKGCYSMTGEGPTVSSSVHMTVTGCIEFCRGRGDHYGAVSGQHCYCTSNMTGWTRRPSDSDCSDTCPAHRYQACGREVNSYASVYFIDHYPLVATSCSHLWNQLVRLPGWYYLLVPGSASSLLVECFGRSVCDEFLVQPLPDSSIKGSVPHSTSSVYQPSQARLFTGDVGFASKLSNANHYVLANFDTLNVVTAVLTQGRQLVSNYGFHIQYTSKITIQYNTSVGTYQYGTTLTANSDSSTVKYNYLVTPVFAETLSLYQVFYYAYPTIRFDALGCSYHNFSHFEYYWGCYVESADNSARVYSAKQKTVSTAAQCRDWCKSQSFAYSAVRNGDVCGCTNSYGTYGKVNDSKCNLPCPGDSSNCGGTNYVAIYRTWETVCPAVPDVPFATFDNRNRTYGSVVNYECVFAYKPVTSMTMMCNQLAMWQTVPSACVEKRCGSPPSVGHASSTNSDDVFNSTAVYSCRLGYKFPDNTYRKNVTCKINEQWETVPSCIELECPEPEILNNASFSYGNKKYSSTTVYTCDAGYEVNGTTATQQTISCDNREEWTNLPLKQCIIVSCGPISVGNAIASTNETLYQTVVTFTCKDGFKYAQGVVANDMKSQCQSNKTWSRQPQSCQEKRCGSPPSVGHASSTNLDDVVNSTAVYACHLGHKFPDNTYRKNVTCKSDEQWEAVSSCIELECPEPEILNNASFSYGNKKFNSTAVYTCDAGYEVNGTTATQQTISCDSQEEWTNLPLKQCIKVSCGPISVGNAIASTNETLYQTVVTFTCKDGFKYGQGVVANDMKSQCQSNKTWSRQPQSCQAKHCGAVPSVGQASSSHSSDSYLSIAVYTCDDGYKFSDNTFTKNSSCQANEQWETIQACVEIECADPVLLATANLTVTKKEFNSTAQYMCLPGFELTGTGDTIQTVTCNKYQQWAPTVVNCSRISCGSISVAHATASTSETSFETVVSFTCVTGYEYQAGEDSNSMKATCNHDKVWSKQPKACERVLCGSPSSVANATLQYSGDRYGDNGTYTCITGHYLPDSSTSQDIVCQADKSWSPAQACQPVSCGMPSVLPNATMSLNGVHFNDSVTFTCNHGYEVVGGATVQDVSCNATGHWEPDTENCQRVSCGALPSIALGYPTANHSLFGDVVQYECGVGCEYQANVTEHDMSITCLGNKTWNKQPRDCVFKRCGRPPAVSNTSAIYNSDEYLQSAMYTCDVGHLLPGNKTTTNSTCRSNATWSPISPCEPVRCPEPQQLNNSVNEVGGVYFNQSVTAVCLPGYMVSLNSTNMTRGTAGNGQTRVCSQDGQWPLFDHRCVADEFYLGCYEQPSAHVIATKYILKGQTVDIGTIHTNLTNPVEICRGFCFDMKGSFAGLTRGRTCLCGSSRKDTSIKSMKRLNDTDCMTHCVAHDSNHWCGGNNTYLMYGRYR